MISTKIILGGSEFFIVPQGFEFTSQSCVKFYGFRLSKKQLITSCEHFINMLKFLGYSDRLNCGYNLKCFKYYELSVYLHGLVSLYCYHFDYTCPSCFGIIRFSHLPHDVLKHDKPLLNLEYAVLHDTKGSDYVVCMADKPIYSRTMKGLENQLSALALKYRINLILVNELPF